VKAFGKAILNEDQTINRDKLGSIVFKDRKQLAVLNGLVHPAVYEEWTRRLALIVRQNPRAIVLADVPLLIEGGMQSLFDIVLLVYISPQEQLRRLVARNGYREEDAKRRLASQMPIREKMAYADLVIANEDGLEETRTRIDDLWEELLRRERRKHEVNGES
jgi:dephospho-CoA kinase